MRKTIKRVAILVLFVVAAVLIIPGLAWISVTHKPEFYREMVNVSRPQQEAEAKRFVGHSLQLRNDIVNEPTWDAVFSDQEVNAWLAEDLVKHFADQLPPEVHEPRVMFELDQVTLAFELDRGPVRSVIWVVARPDVPEPNVLELTIEKIRAGVIPVPAEQLLDRITKNAQRQGLDVSWRRDGEFSVAVLRYTPNSGRDDVKLEHVQVGKGEIRLVGRSDRAKGVVVAPTLPTRKVLQSKFPRTNSQGEAAPPSEEAPETALRSSAGPAS